MKTRKIVRAMQHLLEIDKNEELPDRAAVEEVLQKIDAKQAKFTRKLQKAPEEKQRKLRRKLDLLAQQRSRGEQLLKLIDARS